jgi:hypothetical protein
MLAIRTLAYNEPIRSRTALRRMKMRKILLATIVTAGALAILCTTASAQTQLGAEARLKEKNITLPAPPKPVGNYVEYVKVGNLLYLAGHGPGPDWIGKGKVGKDVTLEQGYQAAREVGLNLLATHVTLLEDSTKSNEW